MQFLEVNSTASMTNSTDLHRPRRPPAGQTRPLSRPHPETFGPPAANE